MEIIIIIIIIIVSLRYDQLTRHPCRLYKQVSNYLPSRPSLAEKNKGTMHSFNLGSYKY